MFAMAFFVCFNCITILIGLTGLLRVKNKKEKEYLKISLVSVNAWKTSEEEH